MNSKPGAGFSKLITANPILKVNRDFQFALKNVSKQVKINHKKQQRFRCNHDAIINFGGVMTTPKRCSFLSFIFTCLCISKPLLIKMSLKANFKLMAKKTEGQKFFRKIFIDKQLNSNQSSV